MIRTIRTPILLVSLLLAGACAVSVSRTVPAPVSVEHAPTRVDTPVKAHLIDGRTVIFPNGFTLIDGTLMGTGHAYGLELESLGPLSRVPLDDVAALETFEHERDPLASAAVSLPLFVASAVGGAGILKAIFGSCPTIYADSAGVPILQAESFSYSIAPLLETRDVDAVSVMPIEDGTIRLEIRNEAMETHYINHIELLEVAHASHEMVLPDARGNVLVFGPLRTPARASTANGEDVTGVVARLDEAAYATGAETLRAALELDPAQPPRDLIELVFVAPRGDSTALVLRARNSLLTTVLLYDFMLGAAGIRALDWIGRDLASIGTAVELGVWYREHMGLRVAVQHADGSWHQAGFVPDVGPIAWKDVAIALAVPVGVDSMRIRLDFLGDAWRIDRIALSDQMRLARPQVLAPSRLIGVDEDRAAAGLTYLAQPDEQYVRTSPGDRFWVEFQTTPPPPGHSRSYLFAAQGYYIEWIRAEWVRLAGSDPTPFVPSDAALVEAARRWVEVKPELEQRFFEARIPAR